jgi:hypothetical protein
MILLLLTLLVLTSDLFAPAAGWDRPGKAVGVFLHTGLVLKHPLLVSDAAALPYPPMPIPARRLLSPAFRQ